MVLLLSSIVCLTFSAFLALILSQKPRAATFVGVIGVVIGGSLCFAPIWDALLHGAALNSSFAWGISFLAANPEESGALHIGLDPLSAFFLLPIVVVSIVSALYGVEYLRGHLEQQRLGQHWFFYNILFASMILTVTAGDGVLFLIAWELMALSSYFLVMFNDQDEGVRKAGWTYLVATHIGTAFLLLFFAMAASELGSVEFDRLTTLSSLDPALVNFLFVCAVIGFGTKAGFMPLHVWLPEAHPAAPSHVSALMSAVMIKTGIYGVLRTLTFLGPPPLWWGWVFIGIGALSGIAGILFALAQHDLKRLLAYCSVENIGIIALGIGVGLVGVANQSTAVAVLGFSGALLHVLNHALFKGLLFLTTGAVIHATHSREMDTLGGVLKLMPQTAILFLIGAVAICGLPPLNGFISEFLIYLGAYRGTMVLLEDSLAPVLIAIAVLAFVGGLAAICFTKAFGMVFLGEPRKMKSDADQLSVKETNSFMTAASAVLAGLCIVVALAAPALPLLLSPVVYTVVERVDDSFAVRETAVVMSESAQLLTHIGLASGLLIIVAIAVTLLRHGLLGDRTVTSSVTWDCGYAAPNARMQYSGSSYVQPVTDIFRHLLRTRLRFTRPEGFFPRSARFESSVPEVSRELIFTPIFTGIDRNLAKLRWLQHGRLQLYVLYIALALIALLYFRLG